MSKGLIGKRSIIYTLSKIISAILSLLSISLFTRIFDADAYGQYLLFVSYVTLICSLFFGGIDYLYIDIIISIKINIARF